MVYVAVTGLPQLLPAAAILTLAGGAIFGLLYGTIIVSFASTLGCDHRVPGFADLLLRDWVQAKFGANLKAINEGVEKEGAFYLFTHAPGAHCSHSLSINLADGLNPH